MPSNPMANPKQAESTLPSRDTLATPSRVPRCQVMVIDRHGSNRCQSEATDLDDAVLLCLDHRIKIIQDLAALPGIEIVITAQPAHNPGVTP